MGLVPRADPVVFTGNPRKVKGFPGFPQGFPTFFLKKAFTPNHISPGLQLKVSRGGSSGAPVIGV